MENYERTAGTFRTMQGEAEAQRVDSMAYLVKCEAQESRWRGATYRTFRSFVLGEKLCSWSLYVRFREIKNHLPLRDLKKVGVNGAVLLVEHTPAVRGLAVEFASEWIAAKGGLPTPQRIVQFLKPHRGKAVRTPKQGASKAQMKAEIKRLLALVKKLEAEKKVVETERDELREKVGKQVTR